MLSIYKSVLMLLFFLRYISLCNILKDQIALEELRKKHLISAQDLNHRIMKYKQYIFILAKYFLHILSLSK